MSNFYLGTLESQGHMILEITIEACMVRVGGACDGLNWIKVKLNFYTRS